MLAFSPTLAPNAPQNGSKILNYCLSKICCTNLYAKVNSLRFVACDKISALTKFYGQNSKSLLVL
jgi:protein tyrosine phosphatase (PTP) superfamily phosphohydrolase (DUF442 family)